jgi:hypothetical protein
MDEIAQEYDVIVLGTGMFYFPSLPASFCHSSRRQTDPRIAELQLDVGSWKFCCHYCANADRF